MTINDLQPGAKINYHAGDEKWKTGTIYGVRKVNDERGNPQPISCLIDTGQSEVVEVREHSQKALAFNKKVEDYIKDGLFAKRVKVHRAQGLQEDQSDNQALEDIKRQAWDDTKHLPEKITKEVISRPKVIELPIENIRSA